MVFPEGPAGKSAYEVWVDGVMDGIIDWPKDQTDINNFFLYLKGADGADGKSAYDIWKEEVVKGIPDPHNSGQQWPKNKTALEDFWYYLTGADGKDGSTPKIIDGNWWINGEDTGVPATGADGSTPYIGSNGNWWIADKDTGVPARGQDGKDGDTPFIGNDGNWWVGSTNTGTPARGPQGLPGEKGESGSDGETPYIGENGNWWIGSTDTGVPAFGQDGDNGNNGNDGNDGKNGLSAYELWKIEVAKGLTDPHHPGQNWPKDKTSTADFWEYLRGNNGENGSDGRSAYEIWKEAVEKGEIIWDGATDVNNFFLYLKGEKGEDGEDGTNGTNGKSAYELWKEMVENGLADPHKPGSIWPKEENTELDFWRYLTGAAGKDGVNGTTPHIGENGNWWIGTTDTGKPARGEKGEDGTDGKSAYEIWKEEVSKGLDDPHTPGEQWPKDKIAIGDFFRFLQGADGKNGIDGIDGTDGTKITISDDGYWVIDGEKTDVKAFGEDGANGSNGKSAYEIWKEDVLAGKLKDPHKTDGTLWPADKISTADFWDYLRGNDGKDGLNGVNGKSAYEIWVEQVKAGLADPHKPGQNWPTTETGLDDFWRYLAGADGITPTIGQDGNWWIGNTNTNVPAKGQNGTNGTTPHIGDNGNWWIGERDTYVPAEGSDGTDGASAYDLWKEAVADGLKNPHDPNGGDWPQDQTTMEDFWAYLRGEDGKDGEDGEDGVVTQPDPTPGMINVIAQYSVDELKEYVNWSNGMVKYKVFDENLDPLPNAQITEMPVIGACNYTSDSNGEFLIPNTDLSDLVDNNTATFGTATVNGQTSSAKTYVPCQIKIRARLYGTPEFQKPSDLYSGETPGMEVPFVVERKVDASSSWTKIPVGIGNTQLNGTIHEITVSGETAVRQSTYAYDLSQENTLVVFRKIVSSKDGSIDGKALEEVLKNDAVRPGKGHAKWWGDYAKDEKRYVTISFGGGNSGCYGQTVYLTSSEGGNPTPVAVQEVPMQPIPMPAEIVIYDLLQGGDNTVTAVRPAVKLSDMDSKIYEELCFEQAYRQSQTTTIGSNAYVIYEAVVANKTDVFSSKVYRIQFMAGGTQTWTSTEALNNTEYFGLSNLNHNISTSTMVNLYTTGSGLWNFFQYPCCELVVNGKYDNGIPEASANVINIESSVIKKLPNATVNLNLKNEISK